MSFIYILQYVYFTSVLILKLKLTDGTKTINNVTAKLDDDDDDDNDGKPQVREIHRGTL